jgi:glycosyltransferase involved in cell wall biosynthesis
MTYNQAGFVEHAIESALAQELDDRYEILIVDDCSNDGTREIVRKYAADHPELIRVLLMDQNMGRCASRARGTREALGTYVAPTRRRRLLDIAAQTAQADRVSGLTSRLCYLLPQRDGRVRR